MASPTPDRPYAPARSGGARLIRELLREADFSAAGIRGIGIDVGLGARALDVPTLGRMLAPVEPLATLVRLFVFNQRVDRGTVQVHLGPERAEALVSSGLARLEGDALAPIVALTPWRDFVIAHDPDPPEDLWPEHISGPTPAAETLVRLVTTNDGRALDLGTGSGLLALAIAAGQASVVATDLNPVALRLTTLNAELNAVGNIRTALGNLFEPVEREAFDLIVSNPPFVIGPASPLLFRQGGAGGDAISRDVLTGAAARLNEGGFAFVMVNWVQRGGEPWLETLRRWLAGTGCDGLCLLHQVEEPLPYAVRWNAREQTVRPDRYGATLDRWLHHFEAESIEEIGSGVVILRRRGGRNWVHGVELEGDTRGDAGTQIRAMFAARDFLGEDALDAGSAAGDAAARALIAASAFRIDADHRLYQTLAARGGEYVVEPAALVTDEGLALATPVRPELIPAVLRLDGSQTVADIAREIADATGGDVDALTDGVVDLVRSLLDRGIALPVGGGR